MVIAKTFEFAAAHRLYNSSWSEAKNREVYGKCSGVNSHGHNYRLEVHLKGPVDTESGMVFDASKLNALVDELIMSDLDHKNIDLDVPWFKGKVSTVENIVEFIWERLDNAISKPARLQKVLVWETGRIFAYKERDA